MTSAKDRAIHYHYADPYEETMQWLSLWEQSEACAEMKNLFSELYKNQQL